MAGQAFLLAAVTVVSLWFPAALPKAQSIAAWITAPPQPPAPPAHEETIAAPKIRPFQYVNSKLYEPKNIPSAVDLIEDPPIPAGAMVASALEIGRAIGDFAVGLLTPAATPVAPPAARAPEPPPAAPRRYRVSSGVKAAEVLTRVQPVYPHLAQQLRVSGPVEVEGVVGLDGRIHDLHVKSGNPLLTQAAMDAVNQWVFRPTMLNGEPVEVIQTVIVNFILK
jgi:protein TonB